MQIAKKKDYFWNQSLPPYSANSEKKKTIFEFNSYHLMYLIAWEKSLFLKEKPYHLIVQIAKKKTIFLTYKVVI